MVRPSEILCPVDLSESSGHALNHALALARSCRARLTVMEAAWGGPPVMEYPVGASIPPPLLLPRQLENLRDELQLFVERDNTAGVKIDIVVREGPVVPMILEVARTTGADLIVIGTHGRSGFERLLLGSVAERTLRKAACAVMTVPPADRTAMPGRDTRSIVCAIDFSPVSLKALAYALSLRKELQATLLLTYVFDGPAARLMSGGVTLETSTYTQKVQDDTRTALRALVPNDARAGCQTEEIVTIGRPHEEIVRLARERDADLIVMGVHGRSALNLALFGSTANQVVRHASCPVVTVRD